MRKHLWITLLALVMGLPLAVACDDNPADPDGGPDVDDAGTEEDSGMMEEDAGPDNSIAGIASRDPRFSMLVAAAARAELVELLSAGEFTVFAPTNEAFEASGLTMADIEALPTDALRGILTYHALAGTVTSGDITAGPTTTAAMLTLFLGTEGGVTLNGGNTVAGGAEVVEADITADNGVIHVIDRVLLPPTVADLARYGGLTELAAAVEAAGLTTTLSDPAAEFTVFAPTNDAFPDDTTGLDVEAVLLYHVVGATVPSTAIPPVANSLRTEEVGGVELNQAIAFDNSGSPVTINGGAGEMGGGDVVIADLVATNGIVHVINGVLMPQTVLGLAAHSDEFSTLETLVGSAAAAVPDTLGDETETLTVFAPVDDAFAGVTAPADPTDILLDHVLDVGAVLSTAIPASATPLGGDDLTFDTTVTPPTVTVDGGTTAQIILTDFGAVNGVVHAIDGVLITPAP